MFNITITDFEKYKTICDSFLLYLKEQGFSSIYDFYSMLKILSGFPYCIDREGHYTYKGEFYNSINELPVDALNEIINMYGK